VRLQSVPPGFTTEHALTMEVAAAGPKYRGDKPVANFYKEFESRVARLPGVLAEDVVSVVPLTGWGGINVEGYAPPPGQELQGDIRVAGTDYFGTMEIPVRKGRLFTEEDTADKPQVVIIEEKFAQRFWRDRDPIGKHLWFDPKKPFTIVGVVGVVKQYGLETDGEIATYFPQALPLPMTCARPETFYCWAAAGLYGVMSHLVAQSTHDIGVLVTLGAQPGNIIGLVVRQGMALQGLESWWALRAQPR